MLLSLLLVPLGIDVFRRLTRRRRQSAAELAALIPIQSGSKSMVGKRRAISMLFYLLGLTLLLFGFARPEMVVSLPQVEGTVILAFDVSQSMSADDLEPTRIDAAKAAARVFVENQPSTIEIGVVAFSNGGLVVQQPTDDRTAVLATIDRLTPQGGTSLAQGIFSSLNAIAGEAIVIPTEMLEGEVGAIEIGDYSSAVILMLSDGENTGPPDPLAVAQVAADAGVRIFPVGIGTADGTVLNIDGFNILTQLDERRLEEIANLTNGAYYHAADEASLLEIYDSVDLRLTIAGDKMEITAILAGMSLLLFLTGGALSMFWFGRMP